MPEVVYVSNILIERVAGPSRLVTAEVKGEVETQGHVLIIRRIHVTYHLIADEKDRDTIEPVHNLHAQNCPIYRSLEGAIKITTNYRLVDVLPERTV